jgi:hypothetical protein
MNLIGKIKAKIHHGTFNGVPDDVQVTVFIAGVKNPLKATLSDIEISDHEPYTAVFHEIGMPKPLQFSYSGTWTTAKDIADSMQIEYNAVAIGGSSLSWKPGKPGVNGVETIGILRKAIPGLAKIKSKCPQCVIDKSQGKEVQKIPVGCSWTTWAEYDQVQLTDVIIHLNDHHKWSREAVASWLEEQDWDLQFVTPEKETAS